jgi:gallate decarboxylase subunit D
MRHERNTAASMIFSEKKASFEINAHISLLGEDLLVILSGGASHIGAIGMAQPGPSLINTGKVTATSSVFTFPGHKEDGLSKSISDKLAKGLNKKTVVVAGLHWDGIKADEIKIIVEMCEKISQRIITELNAHAKRSLRGNQ